VAIFEFDFLEEANPQTAPEAPESLPTIRLPEPRRKGLVSVEEAILKRRSCRELKKDPLTLDDVAQLLWAAQGVTHPEGFRTVPSAGATYPLELYLVVAEVRNLSAGLYRYLPREHSLQRLRNGEFLPLVVSATKGQTWITDARAVIVIGAVPSRTRAKYGERGDRYIHFEVGHAAQNVCLQCEALGLGTAHVGAFDDEGVRQLFRLKEDEIVLCLLPVGKPVNP
jgi:SagB-type dehydrogenase family enzyme